MKSMSADEIKSILLRNTNLVVSSANSGDYYSSRIEDIDDNSLLIAMPTRKGRPVPVGKRTLLNLSALTANGRVAFSSRVQNVVKDPFYMLAIDLPETLRYEQLRQFYRVPAHLRVRIFFGSLEVMRQYEKKDADVPFEGGLVDDLSGGGCRVNTSMELKAGDMVVINFDDSALGGVEDIECHVVRVSLRQNNKKAVALRYWGINETTRDRIIRYVFRRQMELRKISLE